MEYTVYKNGNYFQYVGYDEKLKKQIRLRVTEQEETIPRATYPELVDIKLTNYCKEGCSYCYQESVAKEDKVLEHFISVVEQFPKHVEFAMGGGDVLLIEDELKPKLLYLRKQGYTELNATVKGSSILRNPEAFKSLQEVINHWGISVNSLKEWELIKNIPYIPWERVQFHCIPELWKVEDLIHFLKIRPAYSGVLLLGFKEVGRGIKSGFKPWDKEDIQKLLSTGDTLNVDTMFAVRYLKNTPYADNAGFYEGEFSMNVDLVKGVITKSSYDYDKTYPLNAAIDAFLQIREDVERLKAQ